MERQKVILKINKKELKKKNICTYSKTLITLEKESLGNITLSLQVININSKIKNKTLT